MKCSVFSTAKLLNVNLDGDQDMLATLFKKHLEII